MRVSAGALFIFNLCIFCFPMWLSVVNNTGQRRVFNLYFLPREEDAIFLDIFFNRPPLFLPVFLLLLFRLVPGNALKCGPWPHCCHHCCQSFSVNSFGFLNLPSFFSLPLTHFFPLKRWDWKMSCTFCVCRVCFCIICSSSCGVNRWIFVCSWTVVSLSVCSSVLLPTRAAYKSVFFFP